MSDTDELRSELEDAQIDIEIVESELEDAQHALKETLDALEGVVKFIRKTGGFMFPEDQHTLRVATDLLHDHGRIP